MLDQFFSIDHAKDHALFENLKIWQEEKCRSLHGNNGRTASWKLWR